jgi:DNA invertase Pin-like site-specific DNA recombinase
MRVVIYAAKSTADTHGSIPDQIKECREFASARGWTVDGVPEHDEAASAYTGNRGDGLERAMERATALARSEGSAGLLVWHSNRIARGGGDGPDAAKHLIEYLVWANRASVELHSVQDDHTFSNPIMAVVMGEMAYQESKIKSANVRKGIERRAARGLHNGRPSYGFRDATSGRWEPDPVEAEIVRRIFREVAGGTTQYAITQRLNADGVRPRLAKEWTQGTISALLRKQVYAGLDKDGQAPCPCGHEAIIEPELFAQVQGMLGGRHHGGGPNRRTAAGHLFLNSYLRCGLCGSPLGPRTDKRRGYEVYKCQRVRNHGAGACTAPVIQREFLEGGIVEHFTSKHIDVRAMIARHEANVGERIREVEARRADAQREVIRAQDRLARVRRDYQDGNLDAADWREQRAELTDQQKAAQEQAARLEAQERDLTGVLGMRDGEEEVLRFLNEVREAILAPVRDAETMDALRAGFRRIWPGFAVYPPGTEEAHALGSGGLVLIPIDEDGKWIRPGDSKIALPMATNSYSASFVM